MVSEGRVQTVGAAVTKSGTYGKNIEDLSYHVGQTCFGLGVLLWDSIPQLEPCFASGGLVEGRFRVPPSVALAGRVTLLGAISLN